MKTTLTDSRLRKQLQNIIEEQYPRNIKTEVAEEALSCDDIQRFFEDVLHHGCRCGMICSLIYYSDTHNFFDAYYDEIEELREEWEYSVGEPVKIEGDLKNCLAWFAFEETAYQMANDLGLEI